MNSKVFLIFFLGLIFGFGPFLTDMYLPAFPQLQAYFDTEVSVVQLSLSSCMLGLAVGQVFWGPLSDKYGRKHVTMISLWLFLASCVGCIFAPSIGLFTAMRFVQGVGGSGGIVLSRSIAADLYTGKELARVMALIGAVNGIAPVSAPVAGGLLTDSVGWRGIFGVLFLIGLALIGCCCNFRESLPCQMRSRDSVFNSWSTFRVLLKNRLYVWGVLQYGFLHGIFFSYLSSSPFIIQEHYGFSATGYGVLFAVNATTVGIASVVSMKFRTPSHCTYAASALLLGVSMIQAVVLVENGSVWLYELCTVLQVFCCGLCFASTPSVTMDLERRNAGAAAALLGVCTYVFGFVITPLVGLGDTRITTAALYVTSAVMTLYFAYMLHKGMQNNSGTT